MEEYLSVKLGQKIKMLHLENQKETVVQIMLVMAFIKCNPNYAWQQFIIAL